MRKLSRTALVKKLDRVFSRYIRQKYAVGGWVECVTCGKRLPWELAQAGHWIKRGHHATRWDERNVWPQCPGDNLYKNGLQDEMALHIQRVHGPEALEDLIRLKHTVKKWTVGELRELIDHYEGAL